MLRAERRGDGVALVMVRDQSRDFATAEWISTTSLSFANMSGFLFACSPIFAALFVVVVLNRKSAKKHRNQISSINFNILNPDCPTAVLCFMQSSYQTNYPSKGCCSKKPQTGDIFMLKSFSLSQQQTTATDSGVELSQKRSVLKSQQPQRR